MGTEHGGNGEFGGEEFTDAAVFEDGLRARLLRIPHGGGYSVQIESVGRRRRSATVDRVRHRVRLRRRRPVYRRVEGAIEPGHVRVFEPARDENENE